MAMSTLSLLIPELQKAIVNVHHLALECWGAGYDYKTYKEYVIKSGNTLVMSHNAYFDMTHKLNTEVERINLKESNPS